MVLMDSSKVFDCISHELPIAKLGAYGFRNDCLRRIFDYLTSQKQQIRINSKYSSWFRVTRGVPQGSFLGSLLLKVYI